MSRINSTCIDPLSARDRVAKETHRQRLDYDPERVRIDIAVAVKLCFKYQGLRSLPWGVRRSLATNPGFGSANLLG